MNNSGDNFFSWLHPYKGEVKARYILIITFFTGALSLFELLDKLIDFSKEYDNWFFKFLNSYDQLFYCNIILFSLLCLWVFFWGKTERVHYDVSGFYNFEADSKSIGVSFFDSISNQKDISNRFDRANFNTRSFLKYFKLIWIGWFLLYMALLCFQLIEIDYIGDKDTLNSFKSIVINFTNNLTSLFFVFCLLVLNKVASKKDDDYSLEIDPKWYFLILLPLLLEFVCQVYFKDDIKIDVNSLFATISGMIAMISMSLLIGRLDSKLINKLPNSVLIILYGYSGLQVFLPVYLETGQGGTFEVNAVLVMYLALFCKVVLLLFIFWILKTNRLFFYFLSVYYIHDDIYNEWNEKKRALVQIAKVSSDNLIGNWTIKENYFSNKNFIGIVTGVMKLENFINGYYVGYIELEDKILFKGKDDVLEGQDFYYKVKQKVKIKRAQNGSISIMGSDPKIIERNIDINNYHPDEWIGTQISDHVIIGSSKDDNGAHGSFKLEKILE